MTAYFRIPLDLPHAGTISSRIAHALDARVNWSAPENLKLTEVMRALQELLLPIRSQGENPPPPESSRVRDEAARLGRELVDEIERRGLAADRLGQWVRNLFECLELGEEGAALSLRAGEDPKSPQRPV